MLASRSVTICERDAARITSLLSKVHAPVDHLLFDEIDAATVVPDDELPGDLVRMGATVTFRDMNSADEVTLQLVYPHETDADRHCVSILAPVGAALIGLKTGEQIEWPLPNGRSRMLLVVGVNNDDNRSLP